MKKSATIITLFASAAFSQAAVIYLQDFSGSNPVDASGAIDPIVDDTIYASTGQNITGGSAVAQATNGDYTIDLISSNALANRGFVFNSTLSAVPSQSANQSATVTNTVPGVGFAALDVRYTFTTGSVTIDDQGTSRSGTVFINTRNFNVGGEFLSLNLIQIEEDDLTGEVTLTIDYNAFGDFAVPGTEDIFLTTNFGVANDVSNFRIAPITPDNDTAIEEVYTLQLVAGVPEPSSAALLGLGAVSLLLRRRRN